MACVADRNGVRPIRYGALPPACAALNQVQIGVQRLIVRAAMTGSRELVHAAVALDPLTSAMSTLPKIREMTDKMLAAEARVAAAVRAGSAAECGRRLPRRDAAVSGPGGRQIPLLTVTAALTIA